MKSAASKQGSNSVVTNFSWQAKRCLSSADFTGYVFNTCIKKNVIILCHRSQSVGSHSVSRGSICVIEVILCYRGQSVSYGGHSVSWSFCVIEVSLCHGVTLCHSVILCHGVNLRGHSVSWGQSVSQCQSVLWGHVCFIGSLCVVGSDHHSVYLHSFCFILDT